MGSDEEILNDIKAALEQLSESAERVREASASARRRLSSAVLTLAQSLAGVLPPGSEDELTVRAFELWLECNAPAFRARYGANWRALLEQRARLVHGPDWRRSLALRAASGKKVGGDA